MSLIILLFLFLTLSSLISIQFCNLIAFHTAYRIHFFPGLHWQPLTFWENQSGGRPGSAKGLMALLTETLQGKNST